MNVFVFLHQDAICTGFLSEQFKNRLGKNGRSWEKCEQASVYLRSFCKSTLWLLNTVDIYLCTMLSAVEMCRLTAALGFIHHSGSLPPPPSFSHHHFPPFPFLSKSILEIYTHTHKHSTERNRSSLFILHVDAFKTITHSRAKLRFKLYVFWLG